MRELQIIEMRFLLFECVDCVCILDKLVIIRFFTWTFLNGVDDAVDLIIGLPTMIHDSIGYLLVAAKANDIEANPLDEFLREVADCKFLCACWFREVDEKRMRDFGHAEGLLCGGGVVMGHKQHGRALIYRVLAEGCAPVRWCRGARAKDESELRRSGLELRLSKTPRSPRVPHLLHTSQSFQSLHRYGIAGT